LGCENILYISRAFQRTLDHPVEVWIDPRT
jgi:hypothetical protein